MDNKITKERLKTFFVYDGIKFIASILAVVFALLLIFNAVAKKPTNGQDFYVLLADNIYVGDDGYPFVHTVKEDDNGYSFSYDVLKTNNMLIQDAGYTSSYMMNTYVELGQDDVFIVADNGDGLYDGYIKNNFGVTINSYIQSAKTYLKSNLFIDENGNFNEEQIRKNFIKTRGNDSRFETDKLFNEGVKSEIKRIKLIYKNAVVLEKVLQNHPELLYKEEEIYFEGEVIIKGSFAIDLSKLNGRGDNIIGNMFTRAKTVTNGDKETVEYTTENIVLLVGNNRLEEGDLYFESLAFINKLINTYSTFIDEIPKSEIPEV